MRETAPHEVNINSTRERERERERERGYGTRKIEGKPCLHFHCKRSN